MLTTSNLLSLPDQLNTHRDWRLHILAILFGNMTCLFDFVIFIYFDEVLSAAFFPADSSPFIGHLQALTLFSVGYLFRPIGALIFGRYGDAHGRMPALYISLVIFTLTTLLMACLPTYAQVGIMAPILLIILRVIQGMAFGVQVPLGWVFTAEHAPTNKFAIYSSLVTASLTFGGLIAYTLITLLNYLFTPETLISHGWRIPFVIGGILSIIALVLRRNISETPLFLKRQKQRKQPPKLSQSHIVPTFKRHQVIFLAAILSLTLLSMVIIILLTPKLIALKFALDDTVLIAAYILTLIFAIFGFIFYGWLADKYPVGNVMVCGSLVLIVHTLIFYTLLSSSSPYYILPMCALLGFFSGVRGLSPIILVQLFSTRVRLTSVSIIYNCVSAVVGTTLPIALFYSTNIMNAAPGLFITFIGLVIMMTGVLVQSSPDLNKFENMVDPRQDCAEV